MSIKFVITFTNPKLCRRLQDFKIKREIKRLKLKRIINFLKTTITILRYKNTSKSSIKTSTLPLFLKISLFW